MVRAFTKPPPALVVFTLEVVVLLLLFEAVEVAVVAMLFSTSAVEEVALWRPFVVEAEPFDAVPFNGNPPLEDVDLGTPRILRPPLAASGDFGAYLPAANGEVDRDLSVPVLGGDSNDRPALDALDPRESFREAPVVEPLLEMLSRSSALPTKNKQTNLKMASNISNPNILTYPFART